MPENPLPRIVIDTSIWLLACARKTTGNDMSRVDKQINEVSESQNPKKYRGFLARMLVTHDVIVPTRVLEELKEITRTGILDRDEDGNLGKLVHDGNKQNLQLLIYAMEGLSTDALPTRAQVIRQADIWKRIKMMAAEEKRWVKKFQPSENRVLASAQNAQGIGEEPWLRSRKEWLARLNGNDLSPDIIKEAMGWEASMRSQWPDLVPDYEILLVGESVNAPVASRDRDYLLMWMAAPDLEKNRSVRPRIVKTVPDQNAQEVSMQKLGEVIAKHVKKDMSDLSL